MDEGITTRDDLREWKALAYLENARAQALWDQGDEGDPRAAGVKKAWGPFDAGERPPLDTSPRIRRFLIPVIAPLLEAGWTPERIATAVNLPEALIWRALPMYLRDRRGGGMKMPRQVYIMRGYRTRALLAQGWRHEDIAAHLGTTVSRLEQDLREIADTPRKSRSAA